MNVNVADTAGTAEESARPLSVLESSGLITRLAALQPELEYLFRHVLVQDAAYDTLLKQERRRLHLAVAESLETLYPDRVEENAGLLARHFESAGEGARALPFLIAAGGFALKRYANNEAYAFFERASALLPGTNDPATLRHRVEVGLGLVRSGWVSRTGRELLEEIEEVRPLADELGDPVLLGEVLIWTAILLWQRGDQYEPGTDFYAKANEALETADRTGDHELRGMALTIIGRSTAMSTNPRLATEVLEEAIEITQSRDPIGSSLAADSLAMAYAILGEFDKADKAIQRSYGLAERSGDPIALIDAQIAQSQVETERGNLEEAVRLSRDSATRAAILGVKMCTLVGNYFAGSAELQLGRPALAVQPLQISRDLAQDAEAGWFQNMAEAALSSTTCATGDLEAARAGWAKALDLAARTNDIGSVATILLQRAVALARTPEPDLPSIAGDLEHAIDVLERVGARPRQARARAEYAAILERMGRPDDAAEQRRLAQDLLAAMGLQPAEGSGPN